MFDVSFSELMVIAVVALLVIGPEKLPKLARTLGAFVGRMQRYMAQVKEEVNREMRFEELQKLQQEIKQSVEQETAGLQASIYVPSSHAEIEPKKPKRRVSKKSPPVKPFMASENLAPTPKKATSKPKAKSAEKSAISAIKQSQKLGQKKR